MMTNMASVASEIEARIQDLGDWRGEVLAAVRRVVWATLPEVDEDIKWRKKSNPHGVPVWSSNGMICTGEVYKDKVKVTFAKGASLPDPAGLFNADDRGATRRAIDLREGDVLNESALAGLLLEAVQLNAG